MKPLQALVFSLFIILSNPAQAAFPIYNSSSNFIIATKGADTKQEQAKEENSHMTHKKQWVAIVLALLPLGLHRLYLGYTKEGIIQCMIPVLAMVAAVALVAGGVSAVLGLFLLLVAYGLDLWVFVDFVRICANNLKPKGGEYYKRNKK